MDSFSLLFAGTILQRTQLRIYMWDNYSCCGRKKITIQDKSKRPPNTPNPQIVKCRQAAGTQTPQFPRCLRSAWRPLCMWRRLLKAKMLQASHFATGPPCILAPTPMLEGTVGYNTADRRRGNCALTSFHVPVHENHLRLTIPPVRLPLLKLASGGQAFGAVCAGDFLHMLNC